MTTESKNLDALIKIKQAQLDKIIDELKRHYFIIGGKASDFLGGY